MKPSRLLLAITCALSAAGAFAAENLMELDASGGTSKGAWVMILSKAMAPDAPMGTAAIAVGDGKKFEGAFGMFIETGKPVAAALSEKKIAEERASDKEPAATTVIVKVSADQHAEVRQIVEKWSAIDEHVDRPNDVAVNFAQQVVDALGMKRAYRTGLGLVNPCQYYADLAVRNRKLGKEDT